MTWKAPEGMGSSFEQRKLEKSSCKFREGYEQNKGMKLHHRPRAWLVA